MVFGVCGAICCFDLFEEGAAGRDEAVTKLAQQPEFGTSR
jgi:hypothetical protein